MDDDTIRKKWARERADRIHHKIPIAKFLYDYGYEVHPDLTEDQEEQFPCDLHGDGMDGKPSARAYPTSSSWYCWGCQLSRDAIKTVQDKEGVSFHAACGLLERKYGLPPLSSTHQYIEALKPEKWNPEDPRSRKVTFEEQEERVGRFLMIATKDRSLDMRFCLGAWEAFDVVCYRTKMSKTLTEDKATQALEELFGRVMEKLSN